jgi:RNA polymerase primary sigma factor
VNKIARVLSKFEQENERRPSAEEISERLDLPIDKVDVAMNASGRHVSVDAPFAEGEDNSLLDVMVNDNSPSADRELVRESLQEEIKSALKMLNHRERSIIEAYYGLGTQELTLEEIGAKFGLTRERVRQIREKAIKRLRDNSRNKSLKAYLG